MTAPGGGPHRQRGRRRGGGSSPAMDAGEIRARRRILTMAAVCSRASSPCSPNSASSSARGFSFPFTQLPNRPPSSHTHQSSDVPSPHPLCKAATAEPMSSGDRRQHSFEYDMEIQSDSLITTGQMKEPAITSAFGASKRTAGPAGGDKPKRAASIAGKIDVLGNSGTRGKRKLKVGISSLSPIRKSHEMVHEALHGNNDRPLLFMTDSEEYSSDEEVSDQEFEMHDISCMITDATGDIFHIMEDHVRQMRTDVRSRLNKLYNRINGYMMTGRKNTTKAKKRLTRIH